MKKMTLEDIQELIKFVAKSGATEVDLEFEGIKISIKSPPKKRRGEKEEVVTVIQPPATVVAAETTPSADLTATNKLEPQKQKETKTEDDSKYVTIKASMIGTFYRSSGPDKDAFVNVGDEIKEGSVICIIEAMKLFNEIESEISGKIVKVLVDDNTPVEFDQPLFLVDLS